MWRNLRRRKHDVRCPSLPRFSPHPDHKKHHIYAHFSQNTPQKHAPKKYPVHAPKQPADREYVGGFNVCPLHPFQAHITQPTATWPPSISPPSTPRPSAGALTSNRRKPLKSLATPS